MNKFGLFFIIISIFTFFACKENEDKATLYEPSQHIKSFSWLDTDFMTPVKDQGSMGSCWAFACTGLIEALLKKEQGIEVDLSEQMLVNCAGFGPMDGMTYLKTNGIVTEEELPYTATEGECNEISSTRYKFNHFEIVVVKDLNTNERMDSIKSLVETYGPILTHMTIFDDFDYYRSGIYEQNSTTAVYGHIILIIGWKDDPEVKNGGYWICKNSWGTSWGENGYFKIAYDEVDIATQYVYYAQNVVIE